jgi:ribonucleotide reductase beta subunit family protein with ferritin-like domain
MHRRDESAHSTVFREIVGSVYKNLHDEGKAGFRKYITQALNDFTEADLTHWESILTYLGVPERKAIIGRLEEAVRNKRLRRDYSALLSLFEELGIKEEIGFSFES